MDQSTQGTAEANLDYQGKFSVEMPGARIAFYVRTLDGLAAGTFISDTPDSGVTFQISPTTQYRGQLLDENGQALAGRRVRLSAYLTDLKVDRLNTRFVDTTFHVDDFHTTTDESGKFALTDVPQLIPLRLMAQENAGEPNYGRSFGERYLRPGEVRPLDILHMKPQPATKRTEDFAQQLKNQLVRCQLSRTHLLVAITADKESADRAADFIRRTEIEAAASYLKLFGDAASMREDRALKSLLAQSKSKSPTANNVVLMVLNAAGKALAETTIELPVSDDSNREGSKAGRALDELLQANQPEQVDARQKLDSAIHEARSSGRNVWLQFSQPWCGPCYPLAGWLQSQQNLLQRDYVTLKIDNGRDKHGAEIWDRFTEGIHHGIPFTVVIGPDGKKLVDSAGPLGNVGYPTTFDDLQHFRHMLKTTSMRLTPEEIELLIDKLSAN
jgi:hypothetical protein